MKARKPPKCAAHVVHRYKGKYERWLPCKAEAVGGKYCEAHTPTCPECEEAAHPTGQYLSMNWQRMWKPGHAQVGKMIVVCAKHGKAHTNAIPIPPELRPPRPRLRRAMRGFY